MRIWLNPAIAFSSMLLAIASLSCAQSDSTSIPPRIEEQRPNAGAGTKAKAEPTARFYFRNDFENSPFIARMSGRVWYFPADTPDDWIIAEFSTVRAPDSEPYDPDNTHDVQKIYNPAHYSAGGWFSKTLKADRKIVIIWEYVDAQDQNYKYRFQLYQPAVPGSEPHYKIWNDAWRARL